MKVRLDYWFRSWKQSSEVSSGPFATFPLSNSIEFCFKIWKPGHIHGLCCARNLFKVCKCNESLLTNDMQVSKQVLRSWQQAKLTMSNHSYVVTRLGGIHDRQDRGQRWEWEGMATHVEVLAVKHSPLGNDSGGASSQVHCRLFVDAVVSERLVGRTLIWTLKWFHSSLTRRSDQWQHTQGRWRPMTSSDDTTPQPLSQSQTSTSHGIARLSLAFTSLHISAHLCATVQLWSSHCPMAATMVHSPWH